MNVQDNSTRRTAGRVAFLSLKDEIRKAIEAGWALSVVYDNFKDRLPIRYGQFRTYVRQFVSGDVPQRGSTAASRSLPIETRSHPVPDPVPPSSVAPKRKRLPGEPLAYNPRPAEELLGLTPKKAPR